MRILFALALGYCGMRVLPIHSVTAYFMLVLAGCMFYSFIADEG